MSIITTNAVPRRAVRPLAVVTAPVAALLVWAVAGPLAGIALDVRTGGAVQHVGPVAVAAAALVAGLAAWGLRAALDRRGSGGRTAWLVAALVMLVASFVLGPPAATTTAAALVLGSLHLVVGAVLIGALAPDAR